MNDNQNTNHPADSAVRKAAEQTARGLTGSLRKKPVAIIRMLRRDLDHIRECYKKLVYSKELITQAYEWLYDNYYILEREGRMVIKELGHMEAVPCSSDGVPEIYLHAKALCEAARGSIDASAIEEYIEAAQQVRNFESLELTEFLLMLRAALIAGGVFRLLGEH